MCWQRTGSWQLTAADRRGIDDADARGTLDSNQAGLSFNHWAVAGACSGYSEKIGMENALAGAA